MKELFSTAPKEVVDYFKNRTSITSFHWQDIAPQEHALAFTVAKTAGFDVLGDLKDAVQKAVINRVPFEQFKNDLIPILKQKGWWGERKVVDPKTGEIVKAQLGSLRRLETIYWANVHSSYAAGEWAKTIKNKDFLPFLTYIASTSERKRPLHLSWVGVTLPVDDAWWNSHYPPNGWNCKCSVRQVGGSEAKRLFEQYGKDNAPQDGFKTWINKRTGAKETIPNGIDPGWNNNPGQMRGKTISNELASRIEKIPDRLRREVVAPLSSSSVANFIASGKAIKDQTLPIAVLPEKLLQNVKLKSSLLKISGDIAKNNSSERIAKLLPQVQSILDEGEILQESAADFRFELQIEGGDFIRASIRITKKRDEIFLTNLEILSAEKISKDRAKMNQ